MIISRFHLIPTLLTSTFIQAAIPLAPGVWHLLSIGNAKADEV